MLAHNGVQPDGENVLTKDMRTYLAGVRDGQTARFEADMIALFGGSGRSGPARDDMRIRTGAECFCPQTRGQKIGLISHFGPESTGLKSTFK